MNTGEHITAQGEHVHDEQNGHHPALTELRRRLSSGLARLKLNQTQLAGRAHLGRTTVSEAFQVNGPVPSPRTVTALARALKLPVEELLELQRTAEAESGSDGPDQSGPGKPIDEWEPHDLEVHPAGAAPDADDGGTPGRRLLPEYVRREHDRAMADAVRDAAAGHSRMVVLVGSSSTGKTRTCWEAVQPLATKEWRLWHPFDPTRADAALEDLHRVQPRTVVWLNEAQHYLGDPGVGERIAAALHSLLIQPDRGPVLVLGTLWPEYVDQYTLLPEPGTPDPHSRVRELLAGRTVTVPEAFDEQALAAAAVLADAGDRLLAEALTRARADGRLTQDLAGAPALLHRYEHGSPAAKAVLEAAMDARRLGVGLRLPQAFLTEAATDYLSDTDYDQLTEDWAEAAFAELARPVHGKQAPLRRTTLRPQRRTPGTPAPATSRSTESPVYRLADYLEQHGRAARRPLCPPASFWQAAHTHLTHPNDLGNLATQALNRHRLLWAHHLDCRAADAGHTGAQVHLAQLREKSGDREGAEALYRQAADAGDSSALHHLAMAREVARDREGALALACRATDAGNEITLHALALVRSKIGDWEGVEALCRQAVAAGHTSVLVRLAEGREKGGDLEGAEVLYRQAVEAGDRSALLCLAKVREKGGDLEGAEVLYRQAVEAGDRSALLCLAKVREKGGDLEGAEVLYRQAVEAGDRSALLCLAKVREKGGDLEGAEVLYRQAAEAGDTYAMLRLANRRSEAGDSEGSEALARKAAANPIAFMAVMWGAAQNREGAVALGRWAADAGHIGLVNLLAMVREGAGDLEGAEALHRQAADAGNHHAKLRLAELLRKAGDRQGAEALYQQAAEAGDTSALLPLAELREEAGDMAGAEALAHQAADAGATDSPIGLDRRGWFSTRWPHGLDPDGTPTSPWQ